MQLILPLVAALVFATGALVFKRAYAAGAGVVHAVVVNNVILALLFVPTLAWEPMPIPWHLWYQPVLTAAAFVLGHLLNVLSLRIGDVSVSTPLLGAKVIFVALIARWGFGHTLLPAQWWAAGLATSGVVVMGLTELRAGRSMGRTTLTALGCAAAFALTDTLIQTWGVNFGVLGFLSLQFAALGILSLSTLPFFGWSSLRAPLTAWKWMSLATLLSAIQAFIITVTIAMWRDAAGVNVLYATRGLMSLALVWLVGNWLGNTERQAVGGRTMTFRVLGAALILGAVAIASWSRVDR